MTVIDFRKRRAWNNLKKFVDSGRLAFPPSIEYLRYPEPLSDFGLAFAYMVDGLKDKR